MTDNKQKIEIKKDNNGTIINLLKFIKWDDLFFELKNIFETNSKFWGEDPIILRFPNIDFTDKNLKDLRNLVSKYKLNIESIQTDAIRYWKFFKNYKFKVSAIPESKNINPIPPKPINNQKEESKEKHKEIKNFKENIPFAYFEKFTCYVMSSEQIALRAGQEIKYDGNLVIFGDTNPGCQIYATGSIIIYGKLCGNIHAAWNILDENILSTIFIKALKMGEPLQISIGKYSACSIEKNNNDKEKNKEKFHPETAKLVNGQIWRFADFS